MNFCPRCGNKITKEQRFCSKCGNDLRIFEGDSIESQYEVAERKTSIWPFILVGLVVIGIIVSCCFAYYHFKRRGTAKTNCDNDDPCEER